MGFLVHYSRNIFFQKVFSNLLLELLFSYFHDIFNVAIKKLEFFLINTGWLEWHGRGCNATGLATDRTLTTENTFAQIILHYEPVFLPLHLDHFDGKTRAILLTIHTARAGFVIPGDQAIQMRRNPDPELKRTQVRRFFLKRNHNIPKN